MLSELCRGTVAQQFWLGKVTCYLHLTACTRLAPSSARGVDSHEPLRVLDKYTGTAPLPFLGSRSADIIAVEK